MLIEKEALAGSFHSKQSPNVALKNAEEEPVFSEQYSVSSEQ